MRRPLAALFSGWELQTQHRVAAYNCRDLAAILDMGQTFGRVGHVEMVGMDEIGVIACFNARKDGVGCVEAKVIPAHMRHLEACGTCGDRHNFACNPAQTLRVSVFAPPACHELHAHADAQKRAAP